MAQASTTLSAPTAVSAASVAPLDDAAFTRMRPTPTRLATEATRSRKSAVTRLTSARVAMARVG